MRIITAALNKALAHATYSTAKKGAGLASFMGWHQPKVPEILSR